MRQFTMFTALYLAAGVCLTAIAFQSPEITANLKITFLAVAGLSYLCTVLSTFAYWHQALLRSQQIMGDRPMWQQSFVKIAPWLVIVFTLITSISSLLGQNPTIAALGLPIVLLCAENIFARTQTWE